MTNKHWYAKYPGDYARDTSHLSMLEHGAYNLLLDYYYSTKSAPSANAAILHRICRAVAEDERDAVDRVVREFFIEKNGLLYNNRADKELKKMKEISEKRSQAACKKHANAHANAHANHLHLHTHPHPHIDKGIEPLSNMSESPIDKKKDKQVYPVEFEEIWSEYPRHDCSKSDAFKSYKKFIKEGVTHEIIINGVKKFAASIRGKDVEYIPHAATWLNGKRWEADYNFTNGGIAIAAVPSGKGAQIQAAADSVRAELGLLKR